ncbi:hypothetical protein ACTQ40_08240 [Collinsella sp. Sow4_D11]|uniref:hypothetical protein n=1 Tax=Collinsella sp. Sow4_D11 TaxID=3438775 RepID=UPI003F8FC292
MFGRKQSQEEPGQLHVVVKGADIDGAKALARWLLEHARTGALAALTRPRLARVAEAHITFEPEHGGRALAEAAAMAAEMLWVGAPVAMLVHVGKPGNHALFRADLVVDLRRAPARDERLRDLTMDMTFLCPEALLVMHEPGADLAHELDRAYAAPDAGAEEHAAVPPRA